MLVGYARVSTAEQNLDRQIIALTGYGVDKRSIYQEQVSGTRERPQLKRLLGTGYTIKEICAFTNLSRSTVYRIKNKESEKSATINCR